MAIVDTFVCIMQNIQKVQERKFTLQIMELLVRQFHVKITNFLLISRNSLAGAFMGFDSELEDSGSECDVEGQRQNAIKTAILGKFWP